MRLTSVVATGSSMERTTDDKRREVNDVVNPFKNPPERFGIAYIAFVEVNLVQDARRDFLCFRSRGHRVRGRIRRAELFLPQGVSR